MKTRKISSQIIAGLLVVVYLYATTVKLLSFKMFIIDINNQPIPNWLTPYLVALILLSQTATVILLFKEKTRVFALYLSTTITALFTVYIALIQANIFEYVPCPCVGIIGGFTWWQHFFFILSLLVISVVGIVVTKRSQKLNGSFIIIK